MVIMDMTRGLNHIGRLGENEHRTFRFPDSCEVLTMYPGVSVSVLVKRPGDTVAYPVAPGYVEIRDGAVYWTVQSGDLILVGRGNVELVFVQGDIVAKNIIYDTYVDRALDGAGEAPEPWESWQTDMAQVAAEVEANRQAAQTAATGAETAKTGAETAQSSAETAARNAATGATAAGDAATAAARSAEQANQSAGTAAGAAGAAGQAATAAGQSAQAAAGSATTAGTKATEAAGSATAAGAAALVSEGYALGTQGGVPVGSDSQYCGNNADYHREQAKKWATGTDDSGNPVASTEPQHENSAKYWAEDAAETAEMLGDVALDSTAQEFVELVDDNSILTEEMFDLMIEMLPGDDSGQLILQDLVDENSNLDLLVRELLEREATA